MTIPAIWLTLTIVGVLITMMMLLRGELFLATVWSPLPLSGALFIIAKAARRRWNKHKHRVKTESSDDSARAKLAKVRTDIAELRGKERELEQDLLDEQPDDLPHRKAAGIPDGD